MTDSFQIPYGTPYSGNPNPLGSPLLDHGLGVGVRHVSGRPVSGGDGAHPPGYAGKRVGSPTIPGSSGAIQTERIRDNRAGLGAALWLLLETWLPFTTNFIGRFTPPAARRFDWMSPDDLDTYAGEHIQRWGDFPSGERPFPYPWMTGVVQGFMPMQDQYSKTWAWGKTPSGPGVLTPIPVPWDAQYPTLPKVSG